MSKDSSIEWCDHTYNPWTGCHKISPGCQHCYADTMSHRLRRATWGKNEARLQASPSNLRDPLKWNLAASMAGRPARVFCASMSDILDQAAKQAWRDELWDLVERTPHLDWLLLTKRIDAADDLLPGRWLDGGWPANAWFGVSVENQEYALKRVPLLLKLPAPVRFISAEPLLGPVDLSRWLNKLHWVIVGGESGLSSRPMHPTWARNIRDQCSEAKVSFFFKQWGHYRYASVASRSDGRIYIDGELSLNGAGRAIYFPSDDLVEHRECDQRSPEAYQVGNVIGVAAGKSAPGGGLLDGHLYHTWPATIPRN